MNVSTTYNQSSDYTRTITQGRSEFSFEKENRKWLPVPVESPVNKGRYNYYVREDTSETVYTEKRNLSQIHHGRGSLINIFV